MSILFLLECVGYICYLDCGDGVMSVLQFVQTHQIVYIKYVQLKKRKRKEISFKICFLIIKGKDMGQEDFLEEGKATHASILTWRIPLT